MKPKPALSLLIAASYWAVATCALAQPAPAGAEVAGRGPAGAGGPRGPGGPRPSPLHIERDLEYARFGGRALHLDLYLRATPDNAPLPVVVWLHGGGPNGSDKSPSAAARLVADGYAVASVEYRPVSQAPFPAQVHDVKAAVRWLRANASQYNLDSDHIGAWGEAFGGNLAAMLGVTGEVKALEGDEGNLDQSSRVQAVVDFYGPIDVMRLDPTATRPNPDRPGLPEALMLGGPVLQHADIARAANPITYVAPGAPPFLIVHGTADPSVPARQGEFLQIALKHAGVDASLEYVPGANHTITQVQTPAVAQMVDAFFDRTLRGGKRQRDDLSTVSEPPDSWIDVFPDEQPGTQYKLYETPSRGPHTQASYRIYLPPGYDSPANAGRRYPVIYYLHGVNDDSRKAVAAGYIPRLDVAERSGLMPAAIVVVVQALNAAGYVDSADGKAPVESVFIKDLIPHIDKTYRTVATREGRAIEGHSMGGAGAMHMAFKYPELFSSVSTFSAAVVDNTGDETITRERFGGDAARSLAETPWALARQNADRIRGRMTIRMICGDQDQLMTRNLWMSGVLDDLKISHTFIVSKGAPHSVKEVIARLDDNPFPYYAKVFAAYP